MATTKSNVDLPEPKKRRFAGFRLDDETQAALDTLAKDTDGNRSAALRRLVQQAIVRIPQQDRESML